MRRRPTPPGSRTPTWRRSLPGGGPGGWCGTPDPGGDRAIRPGPALAPPGPRLWLGGWCDAAPTPPGSWTPSWQGTLPGGGPGGWCGRRTLGEQEDSPRASARTSRPPATAGGLVRSSTHTSRLPDLFLAAGSAGGRAGRLVWEEASWATGSSHQGVRQGITGADRKLRLPTHHMKFFQALLCRRVHRIHLGLGSWGSQLHG